MSGAGRGELVKRHAEGSGVSGHRVKSLGEHDPKIWGSQVTYKMSFDIEYI